MECRQHIGQDETCDGGVGLRSLVVGYYWFDEWQPLWTDAKDAFEAGDRARTQLLCELGLDERFHVEGRVASWPLDARHEEWDIAVEWLGEMEIQLVACALGEWETVNDAWSRNNDFLQEFCMAAGGCPSRDGRY